LIAFMPSAGQATGVGPDMTLRAELDGDPVIDRIAETPGTYEMTATTSAAPWYAQCVGFFADPLTTTADAGTEGEHDGGTDGGSSTSADGGTMARLNSDLGCASAPGTMCVAGGLLLLVAMRARRASRR
jgi:hypothetical protein